MNSPEAKIAQLASSVPCCKLVNKVSIKKMGEQQERCGPDIGSQLEQLGQMTVITTRNDSLVAFRVIHTIALEAAACGSHQLVACP